MVVKKANKNNKKDLYNGMQRLFTAELTKKDK